jgi:membrane protein YqaA with SNARE-associated domain
MGLIWFVGAAAWGVAEATLFFVVPDVLLTAAVFRRGLRAALPLAFVAATCAALAGLGMWVWAAEDPAGARHVMLLVPAIGPDLLARVHREIGGDWPLHLLVGAVTGVPYKLYAVEAGAAGINPWLFVPVSFAARLARFGLAMTFAAIGREWLIRMNKAQWSLYLWALAWTAVYVVYFSLRANA